jgi:anti-sigma B factor antagonist
VEITRADVGEVMVLSPSGPYLDANTSPPFCRDATKMAGPGAKVILDLERVRFVDSVGCGAILTLLKHVRTGGGDLKLCAITPPVRMVFELVRLHGLLDIFNTRDEAIRAFQV